ncbi:MAG TPA: NAD(P)/FAD-dependent oxidoreductase [Planctomycetota bacterium]|nr:NAD(P)/FAD-dependent oxidoreductase [Planctomycetota bacterium]
MTPKNGIRAALPLRSSGRPRVVIIGGGFGGLNAARALKRADVDVVLVDRENHHVFQPLLYQVATAGLSPGDIASPIRHILRKQKNLQVLLGEALSVDVERKCVMLDIGEVPYAALIVAAGVTHSYFGNPAWQEIAPGLKTLHDALGIRERILFAFERAERTSDAALQRRLLSFVIIGAGPTGVELAGTLAEIARHTLRHEFRAIRPESARIILLEGGPALLATFPRVLQVKAEEGLRELGVEVRLGTRVTELEPGLVRTERETIEAETILWAAGVTGAALGKTLAAPVDRAGRVRVNPDLTLPGREDVYVVGDLAAFEVEGKLLPGVAQVAMQEATCAARNILLTLEGRARKTFVYKDLGNLATVGRARAVADLGRLRFSGYLAWLFWLFVHLMQLTGFRNRIVVLVQWAFAYATYQRGIRLITGEDRARPPGTS